MNTVHILISYFCNMYFNINSTYTCSSWLVSLFRVSDQNFVRISHLSHVRYMACPPPRLVPNNTNKTDYNEAHSAIFTILLLLPPLTPKYSHTLPIYFVLQGWKTKFLAHTKQKVMFRTGCFPNITQKWLCRMKYYGPHVISGRMIYF
jgi:hypothetical protein